MPSWSPSEVPNEEQPPPAAAADEVEQARRLLEELFADAPADDGPAEPDRPEH